MEPCLRDRDRESAIGEKEPVEEACESHSLEEKLKTEVKSKGRLLVEVMSSVSLG